MVQKRRVRQDLAQTKRVRPTGVRNQGAKSPRLAIVGGGAERRAAIAAWAARHWPVVELAEGARMPSDLVGAVILGRAKKTGVRAPSVHVYRSEEALASYLVYAVAFYYTRHEPFAEAIAARAGARALTMPQVQLFALCASDVRHPEVAQTLGIPIDTLKSRIRVLCRKLEEPRGLGHAAYRLALDALEEPLAPVVPRHLLGERSARED